MDDKDADELIDFWKKIDLFKSSWVAFAEGEGGSSFEFNLFLKQYDLKSLKGK